MRPSLKSTTSRLVSTMIAKSRRSSSGSNASRRRDEKLQCAISDPADENETDEPCHLRAANHEKRIASIVPRSGGGKKAARPAGDDWPSA